MTKKHLYGQIAREREEQAKLDAHTKKLASGLAKTRMELEATQRFWAWRLREWWRGLGARLRAALGRKAGQGR